MLFTAGKPTSHFVMYRHAYLSGGARGTTSHASVNLMSGIARNWCLEVAHLQSCLAEDGYAARSVAVYWTCYIS